MNSLVIFARSGPHISPNTSSGNMTVDCSLWKHALLTMVAKAIWVLALRTLLEVTTVLRISWKISSISLDVGILMLWGRVMITSAASMRENWLDMIISLANITAGFVPDIMTVSMNSFLSVCFCLTSL